MGRLFVTAPHLRAAFLRANRVANEHTNAICCTGDLTGDGVIDGADLTTLLGDWGTDSCQSDITGDGLVDGADLSALLGGWGPSCP